MQDWIFEKACAKVNLALHVFGRRDDGYHELDSIVAFADFGDELKLRHAAQTSLKVAGPFAEWVPQGDDNIVFKALNVWHTATAMPAPQVEIVLEKNLPVASGLGGGSADAAAVLRGLQRLYQIELSETHLQSLAKSLGADVPVCFSQRSCQMQGIGEIIRPLTILLPKAIVLVNPNVACSTQTVFSKLNFKMGETFELPVDIENPPSWRNDLAEAASMFVPQIETVLAALEQEQCFSAVRLSGSGATCFGLCSSPAIAMAAAARLSVRNPNWWVKSASLL